MTKWIVRPIQSYLGRASTFGVLSQIFTALSLFALLKHSFQFGLSDSFKIVMSVYIRAIELTVGQFDPVIKLSITWLHSVFSWDLHFTSNWRYVFIVLQMLFARDAATAFKDGRRKLSMIRFLIGTIISIATSIAVSIPIGIDNLGVNIFIALSIPTALLVYDFAMYISTTLFFFRDIGLGEVSGYITKYNFLRRGVRRTFIRFIIVAAPSLGLFLFPIFRNAPAPAGGIISVFFGTCINIAYWLYMGLVYALNHGRSRADVKKIFLASESGRFGLSVLGVMLYAFLFLSLNAGARFLSL